MKTTLRTALAAVLTLALSSAAHAQTFTSMKPYIKPAKKEGGLVLEQYFLWCPSVIKVGDTYHMFCSAWPAQRHMGGWTTESMCIRSTSTNLLGPYRFQEIVLQKRPGKWDSERVHNIKIVQAGSRYVIFHISTANETGYAESTSITGPWTRHDQAVLPFSNPAPLIRPDGSIYVFGRRGVNHVNRGQAYTAPSYTGPYKIVDNGNNLLPNDCELEDPCIWWANNQFNVICTDWGGHATGRKKAGVQFYSKDGIKYHLVSKEPVNTSTIPFDDGTSVRYSRVERPFVYAEDGVAKAYFLACETTDHKGVIVAHPVDNYVPGISP